MRAPTLRLPFPPVTRPPARRLPLPLAALASLHAASSLAGPAPLGPPVRDLLPYVSRPAPLDAPPFDTTSVTATPGSGTSPSFDGPLRAAALDGPAESAAAGSASASPLDDPLLVAALDGPAESVAASSSPVFALDDPALVAALDGPAESVANAARPSPLDDPRVVAALDGPAASVERTAPRPAPPGERRLVADLGERAGNAASGAPSASPLRDPRLVAALDGPAESVASAARPSPLDDPRAVAALDGPAASAAAATHPSPFAEPALGAALDESATAAPTSDERRRRLAEQGVWLDPYGPSSNAAQLIERIADAGSHGLDPARYDLEGLGDGLDDLFGRASPSAVPALDSPERAALAYRFNRAFTALATDLGRGLVDARPLQRRLFRDRLDPDVDALLASVASGELDVDGVLDTVAPTHERYLRLVETTRKLLAERASGATRTRVAEELALRPGQRHDDVTRLKRRLIETGELPVDTVVTPMFDADLVVALEAFGKRHGIAPGDAAGAAVRTALNRTIENDLDDLAISLERWRWLPRELGERHVFVNLPDYRLTLDNGTQRIVDMPVVIGATRYPTPSFSREMSYLEFNPTWTVPVSIAHRELLPRERRNPGYLKARNFDFLRFVDGRFEKVPYDSVTPEDLARRPFPYTLRQRGGGKNALGRMKFMMPNPHAIYLHDTQAKKHFSLHERAYSHGCIRVSDPDRLATLLLQIDGRSRDEAERLIGSRETRRARLKAPVPTHLAYFTTWIDARGDLQRRADVYEHDPALRDALRAIGVLPSARLAPMQPSG